MCAGQRGDKSGLAMIYMACGTNNAHGYLMPFGRENRKLFGCLLRCFGFIVAHDLFIGSEPFVTEVHQLL